MPIHHKQDAKGHYFQYGKTGAKYYFKPESKRSVTIAHNKALRQTQAIKSSEGRQKKGKGYYTKEGQYVGNPMFQGRGGFSISSIVDKLYPIVFKMGYEKITGKPMPSIPVGMGRKRGGEKPKIFY
jgi:hypothetical protein